MAVVDGALVVVGAVRVRVVLRVHAHPALRVAVGLARRPGRRGRDVALWVDLGGR
jgi:hypothetical protein